MNLLFFYGGAALGAFIFYMYQRFIGIRRKIVLDSFKWYDPDFMPIPKEDVLIKTDSKYFPYVVLDSNDTPSYNQEGKPMYLRHVITHWAYIPTPKDLRDQ